MTVPPTPPEATTRAGPRRIVVAYDGSPPSERAVRFALSGIGGPDAEVWIVHADEAPHTVAEPRTDEERGTEVGAIEQALRTFQSTADAARVHVHAWVREGTPATVLLAAADEVHADLVVVGTRGLRSAGRLLLGSVSSEVVARAKQPVTVVP